jgi:hypothetical protein
MNFPEISLPDGLAILIGIFLAFMVLAWFFFPLAVWRSWDALKDIKKGRAEILKILQRRDAARSDLEELEKRPPTDVEGNKAGKDGENGEAVKIRTPAANPLNR